MDRTQRTRRRIKRLRRTLSETCDLMVDMQLALAKPDCDRLQLFEEMFETLLDTHALTLRSVLGMEKERLRAANGPKPGEQTT